MLFLIAGCVLGTITGLVPGLHSNTVSVLIVAFVKTQDFNFALLIVAMNIVQAFVDFVPNILLGVPDNDSFISVLPGHYFFLKGEALHAIRLAAAGGVIAAILSIPFSFALFLFITQAENFLKSIMAFVLISFVVWTVVRERGIERKVLAAVIVAMSGLLGVVALRGIAFGDALFPLITGFFGVAGLIYSLNSKNVLVDQNLQERNLNGNKTFFAGLLALVAGAIVAIVPSVGPGQAAVIAKEMKGNMGRGEFLTMLGGLNVSNAIFSIVVLFSIGSVRSGAAAAVRELSSLSIENALFIFAAAVFAAGFGALIVEGLGKEAANAMQKLNYRKINAAVLVFSFLMVAVLNGVPGLLLLFTSASIGILAIATKISRTACMSCLIFPTILFYLGL